MPIKAFKILITPWFTLVVLSFLCWKIWEYEIYEHGWEGLLWIEYYHYATPICFGLFLIWANFYISIPVRKRILLNILAFLFGFTLYYLLLILLDYHFKTGPAAMIMHFSVTPLKLYLINALTIFIVPFMAWGAFVILRIFGKKVNIIYPVLSMFCLFLSIPLAVKLLLWLSLDGNDDLIHTIKTGIIIPLWMFSIGMVIAGAWQKQQNSKKEALREN